ncbi:unnamed protein product [Schistosoma margrebowiei]|uniref:Uncharacterized protein n=1 Tax=Schistosoma margrebowiei TaxID=48269 RepID=A0A183LA38_9TREM|nr:unnamed protein product [Schistosoma margrebowiei]
MSRQFYCTELQLQEQQPSSKDLQVFINNCVNKVLNVRLPDIVAEITKLYNEAREMKYVEVGQIVTLKISLLYKYNQSQHQMQEKTTSVAAASAAVGLKVHKGKSEILRYNTACTNPVTIDEEDL